VAIPVDPWLDAVVRLEQGSTHCAGTTISPQGLVLTAYHCVASGGAVHVEFRDGSEAQGQVVGTDVRRDLALVETGADRGDAWIPLALEAPQIGSWVVALGHPLSTTTPLGYLDGTLHWSATDGIVSAVGPVAIQTNALVAPGHSGGPLVDEEGRLVGVISRRLATAGFGFATRPEAVSSLLEQPVEKLSPWGGTFGVRLGFGGGMRSTDVGYGDLEFTLALRDRVWLAGNLGWAPSAERFAEAMGEALWPGSAYALGVRQRLGHGDWTVRLDAGMGVAQWVGLESHASGVRASAPNVEWGGVAALSVRGIRVETFWSDWDGPSTWTLFLDWPGVVAVF
jgi:S1-C subfamily serine protease